MIRLELVYGHIELHKVTQRRSEPPRNKLVLNINGQYLYRLKSGSDS